MKTKEKYILNGQVFYSYEAVEEYARTVGMRVTSTEKIRENTYLVSIDN